LVSIANIISFYVTPSQLTNILVSSSTTAPELFYASLVFVCLSLLAWATIFLGYLIPFVFVAILLTHNGYFPNGDITSSRGVMGGRRTRIGTGRISGMVGEIMPNHLSNPAPAATLDRLRVVMLNEFPSSYAKECCVSIYWALVLFFCLVLVHSLTVQLTYTFNLTT